MSQFSFCSHTNGFTYFAVCSKTHVIPRKHFECKTAINYKNN